MHFGIITPPVSGHLHPFGALGRELIRRGHRVSVFQMPDLSSRVQAEGLEFQEIGGSDHPSGSLTQSLEQLAKLEGLAALRFTIRAVRKTTEMVCRDAPSAIHSARVDALLVDQMEPAGGAVAEHLGLPFFTICNALAINSEPRVPPPFTGWPCGSAPWAQFRNRVGYALSRRTMKPVEAAVAQFRHKWKLAPLRNPEDSFSRRAQISQQPAAFDFPRRTLPESFHYVGPLRGPSLQPVHFPWECLDGRPLIYASLGTLQNQKAAYFHLFAEACRELPVQLVITHGGGLDAETVARFPGSPLVVSYAPQLEVLAKASLTLSHAGLNTVLDSLSCGVPLITVPITYEQPAIASRVRWAGVGKVLRRKRMTAPVLKALIEHVLATPPYRQRALEMQKAIHHAGGAARAADIILASLRN